MFNLIGRIQEKCEQKKGYKNGIILGRRKGRTIIDTDIQGSIFAIADPRSGIFISSVIPTILNWQKNLIILDIKDEFYDITSNYRKSIGQDVIKTTEKNIDNLLLGIRDILNKNKFSLYICISSLESNSFKKKIEFLIEEILKNGEEISEETLFILPYFNRLEETELFKEELYLEKNEKSKLRLFLISDVDSLIELKYNIPILFGSLNKKLLFLNSFEDCKGVRFLETLIEEMKPSVNEVLYFNNIKNIKLEIIEYYKEPYFMKKIKL